MRPSGTCSPALSTESWITMVVLSPSQRAHMKTRWKPAVSNSFLSLPSKFSPPRVECWKIHILRATVIGHRGATRVKKPILHTAIFHLDPCWHPFMIPQVPPGRLLSTKSLKALNTARTKIDWCDAFHTPFQVCVWAVTGTFWSLPSTLLFPNHRDANIPTKTFRFI